MRHIAVLYKRAASATAQTVLAGDVRSGAGLLSSLQRSNHQVVEHATGLTTHHHGGLTAGVDVADEVASISGRSGHSASGSYPQRIHNDFKILLVLMTLVRELERYIQVRQRVKGMMMVMVMMVVMVEAAIQEIYFGALDVDGWRGIGTQHVRGAVIDSGE